MERISVRWVQTVLRHRWIAFSILTSLTFGLALFAASSLVVDNSLESWAKPDAPEVETLYEFRKTFGRADAFVLLIEGDVFSEDFIRDLRALHRAVEELEMKIDLSRGRVSPKAAEVAQTNAEIGFVDDGVDDEKEGFDDDRVMQTVTSLVNIRRTTSDESGLRVEKLLDAAEDASQLAKLKAQVLRDNFFVGQVVDATGRFAVLSAIPIVMPDDELLKINPAMMAVVERFDRDGFRVLCTGLPSIAAEINAMVEADFTVLGTISLALVVLILIILFRSKVGVIGPFLVVVTSVIWTVGFMAVVGFPLSILSTILPAFLFCVGVADSVHFLSIHQRCFADVERETSIVETARVAGPPIFFTSLTTMGGLFSLSFASVKVISELGLAGGVGVVFAWFLSVTLLPVLMSFEIFSKPVEHQKQAPESRVRHDRYERALFWMVNLSKPKQGRPGYTGVLCIGGVGFALALAGISQLSVYHDDLEMVPKDSAVRTTVRTLDKHVGGAAVAELMISGPSGSLKSPEVFGAIERIIQEVLAFDDEVTVEPLVSHAMSVVDIAKETNRAMRGNDEAFYRLPDQKDALSQLLMLFETQSPEETKRLVTLDWSVTHIRFRVRWREATAYKPLVEHIRQVSSRYLPAQLEASGTGPVYIASGLVSLLLHDLSLSFGTAFVFVTILMVVMLRDTKLGLIAMLPNLLPIALVLGYMGWSGLPVDLNSLLVASIALGIAVDDTVHFLHHFKAGLNEYGETELAIAQAVKTAGRAMAITSIILVVGFTVFLFASTTASMRFGLLTALTIVFALIVDMTVLPAILRLMYPGRKSVMPEADAA